MRKLVIILAVFVLLFVAVLVWGVARNRDEPTAENPADESCNGPPKRIKMDQRGIPVLDENNKPVEEVDTDKLGKWVSDCGPTGAKGISNRFAKGTLLDPATISLSGNQSTQTREVDAISDKDKIRVVKLSKGSGGPLEVTATIRGAKAEEQHLCLCEEDQKLTDRDGARICEIALDKKNTCPAGEDNVSGTFAFGHEGGSLRFRSLVRAEAKSRK